MILVIVYVKITISLIKINAHNKIVIRVNKINKIHLINANNISHNKHKKNNHQCKISITSKHCQNNKNKITQLIKINNMININQYQVITRSNNQANKLANNHS